MIVHDLEQRSKEWFRLRAGMPTASVASKLVTSTGKESTSYKDLALMLSADLYAGEPVDAWEGNSATQRGTQLEPEARDAYEFITGTEVIEVGFITDDLEIYGCSPDGLVGGDGMVEIKCQIGKNHVKTLDYYDKHGKAPPDYISQCQMQMSVAERKWCDLFYYHPQLPSIVIRQKPDKKFQEVLVEQLKAVITERDRLINVLEKDY